MRRLLTLAFRLLGNAPPQELLRRVLGLLGRENNKALTIEHCALDQDESLRSLLNTLFAISRGESKEDVARSILKVMEKHKQPQQSALPQEFWNIRLAFWKEHGQLSAQTRLLEKILTLINESSISEEEALTWLQLKPSKNELEVSLLITLLDGQEKSVIHSNEAISIEVLNNWIEGPRSAFGMVGGKLLARAGNSQCRTSLRCKDGLQEILRPLESLTIQPEKEVSTC